MVQQSPTLSSEEQTYSGMTQDTVAFVPEISQTVFPFCRIRELDAEFSVSQPDLVHLDFDSLSCFEVVEQQFLQSGIVFQNAIALKPSNPMFPAETGQTVLIGAPRSGFLDATFIRPIKFISALLTGSRRTVITAFNQSDEVVAKAEISKANLAEPGSMSCPNQAITLESKDIHRIRIRCFGGQFTLDSIAFGY